MQSDRRQMMRRIRFSSIATKSTRQRLWTKEERQRTLHQRVVAAAGIVTGNLTNRKFTMAFAHPDGSISRSFAQLHQTGGDDQALCSLKSHEPCIHSMYEPRTGTWQYVVADPLTKKAIIIIDSALDYKPATQKISASIADAILSLAAQDIYHVDKIVETHAHADHLTAASYLQHRLSRQQGSMRISAACDATSQAAVPKACTLRRESCSICPTMSRSGQATIIRPLSVAAKRYRG